MFKKFIVGFIAIASCGLLSLPSHAAWYGDDNHRSSKHNDGHALVRDVEKPGAKIEFEEDQDEVYEAVQKGHIRPFSEMYAAVERDLHGRIIKVELEEDDDIWVYELKINYDNNIIKVEYNAQTLDMIEIRGRNLKKALKTEE
ncbi:PepSY domain-containing protein [Vibrio renipiscarius]|uniref:Membrane protein n=1 Tax=Vibrio renipiscarius TaxID=1461322 RepID=A0A0C2NN30_9VIBR|nr:PepSY domain-containing protein [Vibrio renipiscarius]KII79470.1 membrane protein [Vibrio renipiscarius]KII80901.1 membrane protein [Vibrio renipiscarius]